jgi:hypothetical protein
MLMTTSATKKKLQYHIYFENVGRKAEKNKITNNNKKSLNFNKINTKITPKSEINKERRQEKMQF